MTITLESAVAKHFKKRARSRDAPNALQSNLLHDGVESCLAERAPRLGVSSSNALDHCERVQQNIRTPHRVGPKRVR